MRDITSLKLRTHNEKRAMSRRAIRMIAKEVRLEYRKLSTLFDKKYARVVALAKASMLLNLYFCGVFDGMDRVSDMIH